MRLKKVKGALEKIKESNYYVDLPEKNKGLWKDEFKNDNHIHVEIGMGKGRFIINMAKKNPNINYIGIEMYDSVLVRATELLENEEEIKKAAIAEYLAKQAEEAKEKNGETTEETEQKEE